MAKNHSVNREKSRHFKKKHQKRKLKEGAILEAKKRLNMIAHKFWSGEAEDWETAENDTF